MKTQGWFVLAIAIAVTAPAFAGPVDNARLAFSRGDFGTGDSILVNWIEAEPNSEKIRDGFLLLESENQLSKREWPTLLEGWAKNTGPVADLAAIYLGSSLIQAGEPEEAAAHFRSLIDSGDLPEPLTIAARVHLVEVLFDLDQSDDALTEIGNLEGNPEVAEYLRGLESGFWLSKGLPQRAVAVFETREVPAFTDHDLFHAALAALHAENPESFSLYENELVKRECEEFLSDLKFEEGIFLANQSDVAAFDKLAEFLREYPEHHRAADAEIALAEMHLNQPIPQPQAARDRQASAAKRPLTLEQSERLDYSAIWTERIGGDLDAVIDRAGRFLDHWPRSERRPEVMLMLARAEFELGRYPEAVEHFERLSAMQGDPEIVEVALFFAAKAASLTLTYENHEKALILWETVAERGGPLAPNALHEKGLLHLASNRLGQALESFEAVLGNESFEISDDLRIALMCDLGHAQFLSALENQNDPELLETAMKSFEVVEHEVDASRAWKYQARVRRGKCLEALGRPDEALEIYFTVVRGNTETGMMRTGAIPMEQFDWLYRAGFSAVELLEEQENWKAAVDLAELLSETGGPRAIEASERANRLRLKHFIWEGE